MNKPTPLLLLLSLYALTPPAHSASFDCSKASSPVEKTICADKQLSDLDELLLLSYKKALVGSANATALKAEQQAWLKKERNVCADKACLTQAYTSRLATLNEQVATAAPQSPLQPGEYLTEKGWGQLTITQDKNAGLRFSIEAMGGNGHSCQLAGAIHDGKSIPDEQDAGGEQCVVSFSAKGDNIEVTPNSEAPCRYFCGMRASFDGLYLKPGKGCEPSALHQTREKFKKLYDKQAYAEARSTLQPLLQQCAPTLDWLEIDWIRNDLALTAYKLGDTAGCQALLQTVSVDANKTDDELHNDYPPTDFDNVLPIVKATRTNMKLCQGR